MDAYDYGLPESAIAQEPVEPRSSARLLVGPGVGDGPVPHHATVADLPGLLRPGDVLVVNDTRVLAARLALVKATGGRAEVLLVEPLGRRRGRDGRRGGVPSGRPWCGPAGACPPAPRCSRPEGSGARWSRWGSRSTRPRRSRHPAGPPARPVGRGPGRARCRCRPTSTAPWPTRTATRPSTRPTGTWSTGRPPPRRPGSTSRPTCWPRARRPGPRLARVDLAIGLDTFRPVTADRRGPRHPHRALHGAGRDGGRLCRRRAGGGRRDHRGAGPGVGGGHRAGCPDAPTSTSTATTSSGWSTCW